MALFDFFEIFECGFSEIFERGFSEIFERMVSALPCPSLIGRSDLGLSNGRERQR